MYTYKQGLEGATAKAIKAQEAALTRSTCKWRSLEGATIGKRWKGYFCRFWLTLRTTYLIPIRLTKCCNMGVHAKLRRLQRWYRIGLPPRLTLRAKQ